MAKKLPQAILLFADGFAIQHRQTIIDFATSQRTPVISGWPVFARSGALLTYGPHLPSSYQRMAYYVDRLLKGARASDLPIEQPTRFELVVNRRAARTLGVDLPRSILLRADDVID
jgi:putative ABC transport system substrate-binding protein